MERKSTSEVLHDLSEREASQILQLLYAGNFIAEDKIIQAIDLIKGLNSQ